MSEFQFFMPIAKVEKKSDGTCIVSGYASTPTKDSDGEIVTLDAIKGALPGYMEYGNIREMHQLKAVGKAQDTSIDSKGLFLRAKISDPVAVKKCLDEVYQGFSIGGRKLAKKGDKITEIEMTEISVVDRPANPDCRITLAKSAKAVGDEPGYLLRAKVRPSPEGKALAKMAKIVEGLAKAGPPAAHDGLSLPAAKANTSPKDDAIDNNKASDGVGEKCEKHGVSGCEKCALEKQKSDELAQKALATSAKSPKDGSNGLSKKVRKLAKAKLEAALGLRNEGFLTLGKSKETAPIGQAYVLPDGLELPTTKIKFSEKDNAMTQVRKAVDSSGDPLTDAVAQLMKRAAMPTKAARMKMAADNIDKSRKAAKAARSEIADVHKMLKASYIAKMQKAAKKDPKDDGDADDFDHAGAMEKLNKAFAKVNEARTMAKAANAQIAKASRTGQRGEEVSDGEGKFYEVPPGIKDLSPSDLAGASPGGPGGGSQPPMYPVDGSVYAGKGADTFDLRKYAKDGLVPADIAELVMKGAKAEGELEVLRRLPAAGSGGRRPYAFDMAKVTAGTGNSDLNKALFDGVDPNALNSGDEMAHTAASARVIGNFLTSGHFGKSMFDPAFRGAAGSGK